MTAEQRRHKNERDREWRRRNRDHIREYNRRVWERIRDSYDEHDRHCARQAAARRRNGVTRAETPYTPHRGWRTPPTWLSRPCEYYALLCDTPQGRDYVRQLRRHRHEQLESMNAI